MATNSKSLYTVSCPEAALLNIVFVHGLTGSADKTWQSVNSDDEGGYWPKWLSQDIPEAAVYAYNYDTSIFPKWAKQEQNLFEQAKSLLESLANYELNDKPLVFITHSLGGLLVKQALRTSSESSDEDWSKMHTQLRLIGFIATPHHGAGLASILRTLFNNFTPTNVKTLQNDFGFLTELNESFAELANKSDFSTLAYYEKYKTNSVALVVDSNSANPGVAECTPVAIDSDHINIVKPEDRDDRLYQAILRRIKNTIKKINALADADTSLAPQDYSLKDESDRRDLLAKLIAADREQEYENANNLQSKFVRKYKKRGLHESHVNSHDEFLSRVETRFNLHVYQPLICNGATDEKILKAIQQNVIEPVCKLYESNTEIAISESSVLEAIYYLTERCNIRWDKQ